MRIFTLTCTQFMRALQLAEKDDEKFPWLRHHEWLLERAFSIDGVVTLRIPDVGDSPRER